MSGAEEWSFHPNKFTQMHRTTPRNGFTVTSSVTISPARHQDKRRKNHRNQLRLLEYVAKAKDFNEAMEQAMQATTELRPTQIACSLTNEAIRLINTCEHTSSYRLTPSQTCSHLVALCIPFEFNDNDIIQTKATRTCLFSVLRAACRMCWMSLE